MSNLSLSKSSIIPFAKSDMENGLTKRIPKMKPFANVLQNRCPFANKVTGLMASNVIQKEPPKQVFFCEYHKMFDKSFFMEHLQWLLLKMVKEFLRISNST